MNINAQKAVKKLEGEFKKAEFGRYGKVVGKPVLKTLKDFCNQNEEFALAVLQTDKTIQQCVEHTVKGVNQSISDIEVYTKAVEFYFPGATIRFSMTIDLGDGGFSNSETPQEQPDNINLSLDSLLDF